MEDIKNLHIGVLGIGHCAYTNLMRVGARTVGDVLNLGEEGLKLCKSLGKKGKKEIIDELMKYGLEMPRYTYNTMLEMFDDEFVKYIVQYIGKNDIEILNNVLSANPNKENDDWHLTLSVYTYYIDMGDYDEKRIVYSIQFRKWGKRKTVFIDDDKKLIKRPQEIYLKRNSEFCIKDKEMKRLLYNDEFH